MAPDSSISELLAAIDLLERTLETTSATADELVVRLRWLRDQIGSADSLAGIVRAEPRPLVVEQVTGVIATIHEASSAFRHAEARALYAEGLTMEQIAELFGVTRQRISTLINDSHR